MRFSTRVPRGSVRSDIGPRSLFPPVELGLLFRFRAPLLLRSDYSLMRALRTHIVLLSPIFLWKIPEQKSTRDSRASSFAGEQTYKREKPLYAGSTACSNQRHDVASGIRR